LFKKSEIFLKLIFPRREIYWKNHFIINFNIRFLVIYTRIWYDASRNHDIGTSRCISQCDIYRRNCSEQPLLSPNRAKISPDVRRLLKIDSRQYGRKKNTQKVLIDKLIQMGQAAIVFPALLYLPRSSICGNIYCLFLFTDGELRVHFVCIYIMYCKNNPSRSN